MESLESADTSNSNPQSRMSLGGFTMIKDGNSLDYCWKECVQSLLECCDIVSVSVSENDETESEIRRWCSVEPRLSINIYPWPNPVGDSDFFVKWIQYAREHTATDRVFQLDCDEVIHESNYAQVRELGIRPGRFSVKCNRLNFWRDSKNLIPHGVCCAHRVVRIGPRDVWMPSDGPHPLGAEFVNMAIESEITIGHYGFLRKREAWFKKAKALQGYFFNSYDPRLEAAEKYEGSWAEMPGITGWEDKLVPFEGTHPKLIHPWLKERGYEC